MRLAASDLGVAEAPRGARVVPDTLCFLAQQAAEKGLKAVLRSRGVVFPRTHNLRVLLGLLPEDVAVPPDVEDAAALSAYAVGSRYPDAREPVTEDELATAVRLARAVVQWAEALLAAPRRGDP